MLTTEKSPASIDLVLAEVRFNKQAIAEEHDFDVRNLAQDLQRRQAAIALLVSPPPDCIESNS